MEAAAWFGVPSSLLDAFRGFVERGQAIQRGGSRHDWSRALDVSLALDKSLLKVRLRITHSQRLARLSNANALTAGRTWTNLGICTIRFLLFTWQ